MTNDTFSREARSFPLLEAIADVGRVRTAETGYERLMTVEAETWLKAIPKRLKEDGEETARARAELEAIASALLPLGKCPATNDLLGRAVTELVRVESKSGGARDVMTRLLGNTVAEKAEREGRRILVVNPGSTSTKVGVFVGIEKTEEFEVHLPPGAPDGVEPRARAIAAWLDEVGVSLNTVDGIACRCGFVKPIPTGTYMVVPEMLSDLENPRIPHASNLAIFIGNELAQLSGRANDITLVTRDPVVSDEMETVERITGFLKIKKDGTGAHYLNHKAVWNLLASMCGKPAVEFNAITAHVGGGASVARHAEGNVTALADAFAGMASANRAGGLDLPRLIQLIKSGEVTTKELERVVFKTGGLLSLAGTNDFRALETFRSKGANNDQCKKIDLVLDFFARQVVRSMLQLTSDGRPTELVAVTGGVARSEMLMSRIKQGLGGSLPLVSVPGALEHESLAAGVLQAFFAQDTLKDYVTERDALAKKRAEEDRLLDTVVFKRQLMFKKPDAPLLSLDEVIDAARICSDDEEPPRIAIVGAENDDALLAARRANVAGEPRMARFSLVGDFTTINEMAYEIDLVIDGVNYEVIDAEDPIAEAIELFDKGEVQILMKGAMKTEKILRGVLRYLKKSGRIKPGDVVSHVLVADIPVRDKLLLVTDAAVNPYPNEDKRAAILENALRVAHCLNIHKPLVGIVSAIESVNASVESSMEASRIAERFADRTDCIVEGPLSFDVAMDPSSAAQKRYPGQVKGNADILLMPDIDAGNVLYKTLTTQSRATAAGIIVAGDMPIVLTSRGDSARSKLASLALSLKAWREWQGKGA